MLAAGDVVTLELGHYRLREHIAGSAYGVIWRAAGPRGDVALKLINQQQMALAQPSLRERWSASAANEIAFLKSLEAWDQRHIVRLLDSGQHDGLPVLALELMQGDLARHVAASTTQAPLARILGWIGQLNQALAKVHQHGWSYLDLKPSNVLLGEQQECVKLADFGTNRASGAAFGATYAGTANWQAPEQFFPADDGSYHSGQRSDYFSLGALFYFLVTGGVVLRFCSDCGQAYREHHTAGAALLRQRGGGAIPATLHAAEETLFMDALGRGLGLAGAGAQAALTLLRALLALRPEERPGHALHISRMLAQVR